MTKLSFAFTLLTTAALVGTAFADDSQRPYGYDRRAPIVDRRIDPAPTPAFKRRPVPIEQRWDVVTSERAGARRGTVLVGLPRTAKYDEMRLVASERGLDIVAVEIRYARGKVQVVRPASDGRVTIDLGRGTATSIAVRYVNRGAGRDASIKVLAKDTDVVASRDHRR